MADNLALIPPSIRDERTPGFVACLDRLDGLDLSVLLVYHIDHVHPSALPALAEQFNVYGRSSWRLAKTEAEQRALIKRAIALHKFKGTPYAVKQAILTLGFNEVDIETRVLEWNDFRVFVRGRPITAEDAELIKDVVDEFGNKRSKLVQLSYGRRDRWGDGRRWGAGGKWGGYQPYELV